MDKKNHRAPWKITSIHQNYPFADLVKIINNYSETQVADKIMDMLIKKEVKYEALENKANVDIICKYADSKLLPQVINILKYEKARKIFEVYADYEGLDEIILGCNENDELVDVDNFYDNLVKDNIKKVFENGTKYVFAVAAWLTESNDETIEKFLELENEKTVICMKDAVKYIDTNETFVKALEMFHNVDDFLKPLSRLNGCLELGDKAASLCIDMYNAYRNPEVINYSQIAFKKCKDIDLIKSLAGSKESLEIYNKLIFDSFAEDNILFAAMHPDKYSERLEKLRKNLDLCINESVAGAVSKAVVLDDEVVQFMRRNVNHPNIASISYKLGEMARENLFMNSDWTIGKYTKAFEKYISNTEVVNWLKRHRFIPDFYLDELLTDRMYRKLSKDPEYVKHIVIEDYSAIKKGILPSVLKQMKYPDYTLVNDVYRLIMDIHKSRNAKERYTLQSEFFVEMNRAMVQNPKDKIRTLRQYCNEVRQKLMERADELMVVSNA